jgi:hypothetical protein
LAEGRGRLRKTDDAGPEGAESETLLPSKTDTAEGRVKIKKDGWNVYGRAFLLGGSEMKTKSGGDADLSSPFRVPVVSLHPKPSRFSSLRRLGNGLLK